MASAVAAPGPRTPSSGPFPDLTSIDVDALEAVWLYVEGFTAGLEPLANYRALGRGLAGLKRSLYLELLRRSPQTPVDRGVAPDTELERAAAWGR